jgi:HSP20 family protein
MLSTFGSFSALDRLLDDVMRDVTGTAFGTSRTAAFTPACDVRANDNEIVFCLDVPGIKRDDLDIVLEGGVLTVKGQRRYAGDASDKVWLGRSYGAFSRSFTLPEHLDTDKLYAELADGVLMVKIPRHERAKPRRIEIGGGNAPPQLKGDGG